MSWISAFGLRLFARGLFHVSTQLLQAGFAVICAWPGSRSLRVLSVGVRRKHTGILDVPAWLFGSAVSVLDSLHLGFAIFLRSSACLSLGVPVASLGRLGLSLLAYDLASVDSNLSLKSFA